MSNRDRLTPRFLLVVAIAYAAASGACASRSQPRVVAEDETGLQPVNETWEVDLLITEGERPRVRIESGYMARFDAGDSTYLEIRPAQDPEVHQPPVVVRIFGEEDGETATLTAQLVVYNEDYQRFRATGDVFVVTHDGRTLETESLTWEEVTREIRSPGFVRIVSPDEELQGYRLRADESLETYEIMQVTGSAVIDEDE